MIENEIHIPKGWDSATLSEITSKLVDGSHNPPPKQADGFPMLSAINIDNNKINFSSYRLITKSSFELEDCRTRIKAGDVLLTIVGAIGRAAVVPDGIRPFTLQRSVAVLTPILVDPKFLMYQIESPELSNFLMRNAKGTAQKGIYLNALGGIEILIPPLNEQKHIVAKIEELFSELDKGIENLKTAREQLKVYRQAILKHAFEGKLTVHWRKQNKDKLESAGRLLECIKRERDAEYRSKTDEWEAALNKGYDISKPRKPKELRGFSEEDFSWLPDLPDEWMWERLGWITCGVEYGTSAKSSESGKVPVLRMGNIQNMKFDWSDLVYTSDTEEITRYSLKEGDVLFNRTNSPELVGKTAIYKGERPAVFAGYLIRINQIERIVDSHYLNFYLNSYAAKQYGNRVKTDGVNQSNINGERLAHYPFPYCSCEEQKVIVSIIEEQLSLVDQMEEDIALELQKSEALRQSILKKAFSGKLVAQDPNDEPASRLLECIRAEKEAQNMESKKPKAKRNVA